MSQDPEKREKAIPMKTSGESCESVQTRPLRIASMLFAALCMWLLPQDAAAKSAEASFTLEVGTAAWKGGRIQNIPIGAKISIEARSDGPVGVLLLDSEGYAAFPESERTVFRGNTQDKLAFSVLAPTTGDYYVIVDNRNGSESRSVELDIRGETDDSRPPPAPEDLSADPPDAEAKLATFEERLAQLFVFEPFGIRVRGCGQPQAFVDASGVVLCKEYLHKLREHLEDPKKMENALLFTLFHEIGHVLLAQWEYPTFASEETADEFATVLIVMLEQKERLRAQAEFFKANASVFEIISKALSNDRHPLSGQRARNIQRWSEDPGLVRRWQPVFVPHMQTSLLERLKQTPRPWTDRALVERELAGRH